MLEKHCSKCNQVKSTNCFSKHSKRSDGLQSVCKECHNILKKEYENKETVHQRRLMRKKAYRTSIKGKIATARSNYKRRKVRSDFRLMYHEWQDILKIFNYKCAYCQENKKLTLDHYFPFHFDFPTNKENCIPACLTCNSSKWRKLVWQEWMPPNFNYIAFDNWLRYNNLSSLKSAYINISSDTWQQFVRYKLLTMEQELV